MSIQNVSEPSNSLSAALNSTEMGSFISRHLALVISLVVLLIVGIFGYGLYSYQASQQNQVHAETLYRFQQAEMEAFTSGETSVAEFMEKFKGIQTEVGSFDGLSSLVIQVSDELLKRGQWEEALVALKMISEHKSNPYLHFFIATREAAALEDLGRYQDAVVVLEGLRSSPVKLMEDKLYLDLGRLYLKLDDKEKARMSFEHVTTIMAQSEFASLAKLYLQEL